MPALLTSHANSYSPPANTPATPTAECDTRPPISATILTKDSAALLREVLASLDWCAEVVILDTGSVDGTLAIAAEFANVSLHQLNGPFPGFGRAHQMAVALAKHDWILSVDSDEIVSPTLRNEIASRSLDPRT